MEPVSVFMWLVEGDQYILEADMHRARVKRCIGETVIGSSYALNMAPMRVCPHSWRKTPPCKEKVCR